jgi:predicted permease
MFKNYLKTAFRAIKRAKGSTAINIIGLSLGIACALLCFMWVQDETSFDRFLPNGENIYRIVEMQRQNGEPFPVAVTPAVIAPYLKETYPQVEHATRVGMVYKLNVTQSENSFFKQLAAAADNEFFQVFQFPVLSGNKETMLSDPGNIVLTRSAALRYFGSLDVLGEPLKLHNHFDLTVSGIIEDIPHNSHIKADLFVPFELLRSFGFDLDHWGSNSFYSYVQLTPGSDYQAFSNTIATTLEDHDCGYEVKISLQPLHDIYLRSNYVADVVTHHKIRFVRIVAIVAALILLIACINFMNLATAHAFKRAKEVGMRKVIGARRNNLIIQFYLESIMLTLLSLGIGLIIVEAILPVFNNFTGKVLSLNIFINPHLLLIIVGCTLFTAVMAGSYPALYLSHFSPATVLKSARNSSKGSALFRKILVVVQYTLAIGLICSTLFIQRQITYLQHVNLGYDTEEVLYVPTGRQGMQQFDSMKEQLLALSGVESVSTASSLPFSIYNSGYGLSWPGKNEDDKYLVHTVSVSYDFFKTLNLEFAEGRPFSAKIASDSAAFVVNEQLVKLMNKEHGVGEEVSYYSEYMPIIGVVKDFHFKSLHNAIEPLIIFMDGNAKEDMFIRINTAQANQAIQEIESIWTSINPDSQFKSSFLNERYNRLYLDETRMAALIRVATWLAMIIASLGLLGLSSFMTQQRIKEIGIRKVLGASIQQITLLLTRDFIIWVAIAIGLAVPFSWYILTGWLSGFAYRIPLSPVVFIIAAITAILISVVTVSFITIRAAQTNPSNILKYE